MFTKSKNSVDGLVSQCRKCRSEYMAQRRSKPEVKAKESAYSANRYKEHKEEICKKTTAWRKANPEKARESVNKYAEKNREKKRDADKKRYHADLEASRAAGRKKYALNSETRRLAAKLWRQRNKETVRAWGRAWAQLNKEKYAKRAEHRRRLKDSMSEFDRFVMHEAAVLCGLRGDVTKIDWQIDHIVPLSKGGTHAAENLQVVPAVWNAAKRDHHCEKYFG
jgi:5-methylcytosine-specific restriction endonuclease McrA